MVCLMVGSKPAYLLQLLPVLSQTQSQRSIAFHRSNDQNLPQHPGLGPAPAGKCPSLRHFLHLLPPPETPPAKPLLHRLHHISVSILPRPPPQLLKPICQPPLPNPKPPLLSPSGNLHSLRSLHPNPHHLSLLALHRRRRLSLQPASTPAEIAHQISLSCPVVIFATSSMTSKLPTSFPHPIILLDSPDST